MYIDTPKALAVMALVVAAALSVYEVPKVSWTTTGMAAQAKSPDMAVEEVLK